MRLQRRNLPRHHRTRHTKLHRHRRKTPKLGDPKRVVVELEPVRAFATPVPLAVFREDAVLQHTDLVRISRLSVMPLTPEQHERVRERSAAAPGPVRRAPGAPARPRRRTS